MNSHDDIEDTLKQIGKRWPNDDTFVDQVLRDIDRGPGNVQAIKVQTLRRVSMKAPIAIAASLAVLVTAWWNVDSGNSLYAQVTAAVHHARAVRMVQYVEPTDSDPVVVAQMWYQRNVGFRVEQDDVVRVGNRDYMWAYTKSSKTAVRSATDGIDKALEPLFSQVENIATQLDDEFERFPEGDQQIDGKLCQAYLLSNFERYADPSLKQGRTRLIALLDPEVRLVRAITEVKIEGQWMRSYVDWKYDEEFAPSLFEADFGDGVNIVDADEAFRHMFDPATAVHSEERDGLIFSIHQISRFDENGVYLVSSVRGTEETLKEFPLTKRRVRPGEFLVDGPALASGGSPQTPGDWEKKIPGCYHLPLAAATHEGVDVSWLVMIPRGAPHTFEPEAGTIRFKVRIIPTGEFARAKYGKKRYISWDIELPVPQPTAVPSLADIASRIHADQQVLEGFPFKHLSVGNYDEHKAAQANEISVEGFAKAVREMVASWQEADKSLE